ncbi:MAG: hypothetical protein HY657_00080 [Acidobacteria bacterium]|nr:hypothetical protein [Acidobacteriota bacterium]
MRHRFLGTLAAAVAIALVCWPAAPMAEQQGGAQPVAPGDAPIPRTPDGKPDLSGLWAKNIQQDTYGMGLLAAGLRAREFTPFGLTLYEARVHQVDPDAFCWLPGVPRLDNDPYPLEILQRPDRVIILYEFNHNFRVIHTDGRPHPPDLEPSFLGHSIGRWEGDTLVVDVVGFNDKTWLDDHGNVHSDRMRVIERFTRLPGNRLQFQFTIEDPVVYAKPWTSAARVWPLADPSWRIMEYSCTAYNNVLSAAGGGTTPGPHSLGRPDVLETAGQDGPGGREGGAGGRQGGTPQN